MAGGTTIDIGAILTERQYVAAEDVERARALASSRSASLTQTLLEEGIITRELLGQAVAEHLGVSFADLQNRPPSPQMVTGIPEDIARQFTVVVFSEDDTSVVVATDEKDKQGMTAALRSVFGSKRLVRAYALTEDIEALFVHYQKPLSGRLTEVAAQSDLPAPQLVDEIMRDALTLNASDVHIEPRADGLTVRFRIDGVLHEAVRLDLALAAPILNRIKVLAKLRLDDHFSAQDGAIRYTLEHETVDVRVSVVPTVDGEKTVMRLLTGSMRGLGLGDLGLSPMHVQLLKEAAKKPFGMILTTGPTGSGKTTTLYAVLKSMNHGGINITTIEDPVEYRISGVNQIQVNAATGLTFADGLRAIVRQNPDAILVGEIRDHDTAEIAINSALTGHLLFSTFHANDAATAVPRLMEIGVEPFLASSTLELVIAQRLVRRICETCRTAVSLSASEVKAILGPSAKRVSSKGLRLYRGKGCASCNNIGYRGRIGIFELLPISRAMRELILRRPSSQEIWKLARTEGVAGMFDDGMEKVTGGLTTLEELARVVNADEL
jgi:type IV pilus assembly protein PilB